MDGRKPVPTPFRSIHVSFPRGLVPCTAETTVGSYTPCIQLWTILWSTDVQPIGRPTVQFQGVQRSELLKPCFACETRNADDVEEASVPRSRQLRSFARGP